MGAIAALYVSRVCIEFGPPGWPVSLLWLAGLVLGLAGLGAAVVIHAFGCEVFPVAALALYLVSPTLNPHLAAAAALVAGVGVLISLANRPSLATLPPAGANLVARLSPGLVSDAGVFLVSLSVYVATLSPGLLPADSGEFQLVAPTLGIAHPPGYALYTLVGKLFTLIPAGTPAYRLNLLSAVLAAATLVLVNRTTRRLTRSVLAGLGAVLALAGATTFWAQATTANIRMPTAFFAVLVLWLLVRYSETRRDRDLAFTAFAFGLGLTHHGSLIFVALPAALYVLWLEPRIAKNGRLLAKCTAAFALALLVLLYFPIRGLADAPLNPGGLTTLNGFLDHVLARGFRGDVLAFTEQQVLVDRFDVLLNILNIQFNWPLLIFAALGLAFPLIKHLTSGLQPLIAEATLALPQSPISILHSPFSILHSPFSILHSPFSNTHWFLLASAFALTAGAAITYRAPQTVEYLMPAYVTLAILVGVGIADLARRMPSSMLRALLLSVALGLGLTNVWQRAPSHRELSRQPDTRRYVEPILRDAPRDTTILSNWHWATAFWYLQTVEGLRPDVTVEYVAPAGAEPYPETWRRRLAAGSAGRSVIVTNRYRTYATLPGRLAPFHEAFLATAAAVRVPDRATPLDLSFEDTIKLRAYTLSGTHLESGEDLTVRLWWEPQVDAERDYSVFVHLVDSAGRPIGQADVRYPASRLTRGALIEDAYTLPVLPTVPPGEYSVVAGFYFTPPEGGFRRLTADGVDLVQLGQVTLGGRRTPPVTRHQLEVPFAGGPTLIGADYDTSYPGSTRVYLHWRAAHGGPWTATLTRSGQPAGSGRVPAAPAGTVLTVAVDVPPDTRELHLALSAGSGTVLPALGAWRLPILGTSVPLPKIEPGDRYLGLGGEMALVGADWHAEGSEVVVDLAWVSLKPLVRDYTVSVQLLGESGWRAQHDGTPALGAIPTLKWVRGTRVVDRHRIELPEEAEGPAELQISVYDAFTQTPLGVLDDRFQRAGQGQAAVIGRSNSRFGGQHTE
ncbi:MAG: hypothetical protein MAG451_01312 [Anaerolineales bacterium]|nr:hypothetical protein [Anaerolineales bacterium]